MPRPKKKLPPPEEDPLPEGISIEATVQYYDQGWRYGTLRSVKNGQACIESMPVYGKKKGQDSYVPINEVRKI